MSLWHGQGISARASKRTKKERKTEMRWEGNIKDVTVDSGESVRAAEDRVG